MTTAALSTKLCYPAIIEVRDQRRIDNPHDPAIKLLDRDIQRHIRQELQDQWRILLKSSNSATNPSVTGFSSASCAASGRTRHQAFQSPSRKTHACSNAIVRAFNSQFTDCSVPQDQTLRRLMSKIYHHPRVDPSYRPFDERGVASAIKKAGSSTDQGHDRLTLLHLRHQGTYGIAFLTELLNLSVAGVDIRAIWKNSVIVPILKVGTPREQDREDHGAAPSSDHSDGSRKHVPNQHGFKTESLPYWDDPPPRLWHNLIRWLVAYLCSRKGLVSLPVAPFVFPPGGAGDPTGFHHLPSSL